MPMIEFHYKPEKVIRAKAAQIIAALEEILRSALREVRPSITEGYGVSVEGEPFTFHHNQPDLRIYVFYHQEWNFKPEELEELPKAMGRLLESIIERLGIVEVNGKIRFYVRSGHASASFGK